MIPRNRVSVCVATPIWAICLKMKCDAMLFLFFLFIHHLLPIHSILAYRIPTILSLSIREYFIGVHLSF